MSSFDIGRPWLLDDRPITKSECEEWKKARLGNEPPIDLVVMSPTIQRAVREFEAFVLLLKSSKWRTILKGTDRIRLYVELLGGNRIYFKGETEGKGALIGLHSNIVSIDEFLKTTEKEVKNGR